MDLILTSPSLIIRTLIISCLFSAIPSGQSQNAKTDQPLVLGHGVGLFKVGEILFQDDFDQLDQWVVQIQSKSGFPPAKVDVLNHTLDCFVPGRGCTVWFRKKLPSRVTITYSVICPTPDPSIKGLQPRDINNFWMAQDPVNADKGLFDLQHYTGAFGSYDKMHCYYASTGGGGAVANKTTRMRRYPREVNGKPVEHIALNDKDGRPGYLITPDKLMKVQLVAFDDVVQYIVDDKLVYQITSGDSVQIEYKDENGRIQNQNVDYDIDRFPVYKEGYFGFRMVGTHHIYSNFKVFALKPAIKR